MVLNLSDLQLHTVPHADKLIQSVPQVRIIYHPYPQQVKVGVLWLLW